MGNTDPNKTKAGNKYEVKPQYEELSKQLGGRHSNPVVTTPTIALDFSGTTQQSASHNVAPNQQFTTSKHSHVHAQTAKSCSIRTFLLNLPNRFPPGSNHAAGHFPEAEICYNTANILAQSQHKSILQKSISSNLHFSLRKIQQQQPTKAIAQNKSKRHRSNLSKRRRSNHQQTTALAQAKQPRADNSSLYKKSICWSRENTQNDDASTKSNDVISYT
ncbi:hypothetical protein F511_24454 [Dorcoceras hygrometricum]|uniref:Uncharacterized protein n=1 Tax=Dorcoceras hygrometricum TaxID=472368 RepID=A0A2Z7B3B6_9LAMI|nr:hypothetical protein F511_24454 [Dorcoceras hygrometricum]